MGLSISAVACAFHGAGITPAQLFAAGEQGAWYDISDITKLFTDSAGTVPVTAQGDVIGKIVDSSPRGNNLTQTTAGFKPTYDSVALSVGMGASVGKRVKYDFVDDKFIWSGPTGTYDIAIHNISGVQFYSVILTTAVTVVPLADFFSMILIDRTLTAAEKNQIKEAFYPRTRETPVGADARFECRGTSYVGRGGTVTAGTIAWSFGSGAAYTTMFASTQATTNRERLDFKVSNPAALTIFNCNSNNLTGSIPSLSANTALQYFYCYSNNLTGSIPSLSANTALISFLCNSNNLTGSIPSLSANTALQYFYCYSNNLTGSIPSLAANTALIQFQCNNNALTGSIPSLAANTALIQFQCNNNALTGSIPSLSANTALISFQCNSNTLTGSIPSLAANTALQYFYCYSNTLTGSIPSLAANTALQYFYCYSNTLTGSIPSLSANTALISFKCNSNTLTGSIPSLSANTALSSFLCNSNALTGYAGGGVSINLGYFDASINSLTQAAVDLILSDFVAANKTTGTRVLTLSGGTNATPSAAGLTNKTTLIGRGWTVTTN